jgi:hypothetical protein
MRKILISILVLTSLGILCGCQPTQNTKASDSVASTLGGHPNLNGVWQSLSTANWNLESHSAELMNNAESLGAIGGIPAGVSVITPKTNGKIPYLPQALEQRNVNRAAAPAADPEALCYMLGVPRQIYHNLPFQIFQSDNDDLLFAAPFAASNRVIFMNTKEELPIEAWMGRSNGHWEDDTLVIETRSQNAETWLDRSGNYHSEALVVTERLKLLDDSHLQYTATLEDPLVYSRPWEISLILYRHIEEDAQLLEHKCVTFADNLLYGDLLESRMTDIAPIRD